MHVSLKCIKMLLQQQKISAKKKHMYIQNYKTNKCKYFTQNSFANVKMCVFDCTKKVLYFVLCKINKMKKETTKIFQLNMQILNDTQCTNICTYLCMYIEMYFIVHILHTYIQP